MEVRIKSSKFDTHQIWDELDIKSKTYLVDQGYENIDGMLQKWFQHSVSKSFMSFTANFFKQICFAEQKGKQKNAGFPGSKAQVTNIELRHWWIARNELWTFQIECQWHV